MARTIGSPIRQHIIDMLSVAKKGYGYQIYGWYLDLFPKVHQRSIYYHLRKGVELKELEMHEVKLIKGEYSWGGVSQRIYYTLGEKANPRQRKRISTYFSSLAEQADPQDES